MANSLRDQIISALEEAKEPISTLDLAKKVGKTTPKEINPDLYSLLAEKRVIKTARPDGTRPKWSLSGRNKSEEDIMSLLKGEKEPILTRTLVGRLNEADITRKDVNSILYSLEKRGVVTKSADPDGRNPRWKISS